LHFSINPSFPLLCDHASFSSVFARLNYSYRYKQEGIKIKLDEYPCITDGKYAYFNNGFSNSPVFPKHRLGAEFYSNLPASFEGSLGFRHLYFGSRRSANIFPCTFGYYYGIHWFSLRPYLTPDTSSSSISASLTTRCLFADLEDYISFRRGSDFTAEERFVRSSEGLENKDIFYLHSKRKVTIWEVT
jgi:YaiO family outer membrane protein